MEMKKTTLGMILATTLLATSCLSEEQGLEPKGNEDGQKGKIVLDLSADASFNEQTRALNEANYRNTDNYDVQVVNTSTQVVALSCKGSEVSTNLPKELEIGTYEVRASYGTESPASRNNFRVEGSATVQIKAEGTATATVNCAPTCGKVYVAFDDAMATYYDDYSLIFGGTEALGTNTFAWAKADTEPWYVRLGNTAETINYTLSVTAKDEYAHLDGTEKVKTGTVTGSFQLERNKAQKLTIVPNYTPMTEGGLSITITIDGSVNEKPVTITVPVSWLD